MTGGKTEVNNFEEIINCINNQQKNKVVSVYLTGSRLYGFNQENSDYDLKVYVLPTIEDIALNRMVSKQINVGINNVDKVDIKDIRYQYSELTKPNFGSLHLLELPVYGEMLFSKKSIEAAFKSGKKNLLLSLLGTFRSRQKIEGTKENAHLYFLLETAKFWWENDPVFHYFQTNKAKELAKSCVEYRNGKSVNRSEWISESDALFDEVMKNKDNNKEQVDYVRHEFLKVVEKMLKK